MGAEVRIKKESEKDEDGMDSNSYYQDKIGINR